MINTVVAVLFLAIGIGMGIGINEATPYNKRATQLVKLHDLLITRCEKELPRDQFCEIKTTAHLKEIEK